MYKVFPHNVQDLGLNKWVLFIWRFLNFRDEKFLHVCLPCVFLINNVFNIGFHKEGTGNFESFNVLLYDVFQDYALLQNLNCKLDTKITMLPPFHDFFSYDDIVLVF